jgi:hypothetical protein
MNTFCTPRRLFHGNWSNAVKRGELTSKAICDLGMKMHADIKDFPTNEISLGPSSVHIEQASASVASASTQLDPFHVDTRSCGKLCAHRRGVKPQNLKWLSKDENGRSRTDRDDPTPAKARQKFVERPHDILDLAFDLQCAVLALSQKEQFQPSRLLDDHSPL